MIQQIQLSHEEDPLSLRDKSFSSTRVGIADFDPYFDLYQTIHSLIKESDSEGERDKMSLPLKGEAVAGYCTESSYFAAAVLLKLHIVKKSQIFLHQLNELLPQCGLRENLGHVVLYVRNGGSLLKMENHDIFFDATCTQFNGRLEMDSGDFDRTNVFRNLCSSGAEGKKMARELVCRGYVLINNQIGMNEKLGTLLSAYQEGVAQSPSSEEQQKAVDPRKMYFHSVDTNHTISTNGLPQWLRWKLTRDWNERIGEITRAEGRIYSPLYRMNYSGSLHRQAPST